MFTDWSSEEPKKHNGDDSRYGAAPVIRTSAAGMFALAVLAFAATPTGAKEARLDCGFPEISGGYSSAFEIVIDYDAMKVTMTGANGVSEPLAANITDSTVSWAASQPMPGQAVRWTLDRYSGEFRPYYRDLASGTISSGVPGKCFLKQPKF
jgi:hypothetical protein